MEAEKILISPNFIFSGNKTTKDLRHGGQRKQSVNMYTTQFKMR